MPRFQCDSQVNTIAFKNSEDVLTLAVGSFVMQRNNKVTILSLLSTDDLPKEPRYGAAEQQEDQEKLQIVTVAELPHVYPPTDLHWAPSTSVQTDLLATSGEKVQIWQVQGSNVQLLWDVQDD